MDKKTKRKEIKCLIVDGKDFGEFPKEKTSRMLHLKGVQLVTKLVDVAKKRKKKPPAEQPSLIADVPTLQPFTGKRANN